MIRKRIRDKFECPDEDCRNSLIILGRRQREKEIIKIITNWFAISKLKEEEFLTLNKKEFNKLISLIKNEN